jgi:hypothetical protein
VRNSFKRATIVALWAIFVATGFAASAEDASEALKMTLRIQVGDGCQIRETPHWLIAHNADPQWVDGAAEMLERTHDLFFEQFRKAGFNPQPLGQKLVCVLLGKQEAFAQYLERVRDVADQSPPTEQAVPNAGKVKPRVGLGSYSEHTNRIQMCDIRDIVPPAAQTRLGTDLERQNVARISHEAAHQLSFNTGVLKQHAGYPTWLGEGLATNFEFSDADKPFGPLTANLSPRADRLRQFCADGKLLPLRQIVTMSPYEAHQPANKGPVYIEGWGLFRFLFTEHPQQLKQYITALTDRPRGPVRRSEVLATFESAFGPSDELNQGWKQFLQCLCSGESKGKSP